MATTKYALNTTPSNQKRHTNVATVRALKGGIHFEIACYRNKVLSWRNKIETDIAEVLQVEQVFTNVAQGQLASKKDLEKAFGNSDRTAAIRYVLDHGELQVSEEEREHAQESMFRDVAAIVVDKSNNPENNRPYTLSMIHTAMKEIHYSVNTSKGAKSQALDVIRRLKAVMPIARAKMKVRLECPTRMWMHVCEAIASTGIPVQLLPEAGAGAGAGGGGSAEVETAADSTVFTAAAAASKAADSDTPATGEATGTAAAAVPAEKEPISSFDFLIDPEAYRPLQVVMENVCGIKGFVQVLLLNASAANTDGSSSGAANASEDAVLTSAHVPAAAEEEEDEKDGGNAYTYNSDQDQLDAQHTGTFKVGKREKRAIKDAKIAKEAEAALLKARLERDAEREENKTIAAMQEDIANKAAGEEATEPVFATNSTPASIVVQPTCTEGGLKACNTCGGAFDSAGYRAHFRSEWHRFNLKAKLKNKRAIDEATFLALSVEALALVNM